MLELMTADIRFIHKILLMQLLLWRLYTNV